MTIIDSEQNIQDILLKRLCYENMVEKWGVGGFHTFSRSVFDRVRAHTTVWNGDAHSDWTGLAYSVASGIRSGLIGFSHWTSDTGGYVRGPDDPAEDLWARWMQFSTFTPEYVLLLGTNLTPWYPPYSADLVATLKRTANLHHELIPYIKSYSYLATQTGVPVMRALFLEYPRDKNTYSISDEYFFGEQFLVAPIVTESGEGQVYFPRGTDYLEYFNKTLVYQGGRTEDFALPTTSIPVFVKAGAIAPRGDIVQANNKWTKAWRPWLNIKVFPSFSVNSSTFAYYNGKSMTEIQMTTSRRGSCVKVQYGDVGVEGKLVVYTKDGPLEEPLSGGTAGFCDIDSLFS
jgi:alpha-glucosidase (family GH31 glycosyl hydrolase)